MNYSPGIWPPSNMVQKVSMFFIDIGESGRQLYYGFHAFIFFTLVALSVYAWFTNMPAYRGGGLSRIKGVIYSDYFFLILLFLFILLARFPLASNGILNPDEPYWVAEAKTLLHDFRPWVSIDTGTGGPIVPLALLSLKLFGLPIDQGSIKILGGVVVALSTVFVFIGLAHVIGSTLSRSIILPLAVVFSAMKSNDLTAYNSEHPVILLISTSFFLLCRLYACGRGRYSINLVLLGFCLGLVPYAKLQGAPIALFIGFTAIFIVYKHLPRMQLFILVVSALLPTLLTLSALLSYGGLRDFWISYLSYNLNYASQIAIPDGGVFSKIKLFFDLLFFAPELRFYAYLSGAIIFITSFTFLFLLRKVNNAGKIEILFALMLFVVSAFSIVAPGRFFLHYILLSLVPVTILSALFTHGVLNVGANFFVLRESLAKTTKVLTMAIFFGIIGFFYFMNIGANKIDYREKAREHYDGFAPQGLIGAVLDHYFSEGARIAVWEYEPEIFEGNNFLIGTRDAATAFGLQTELQSYYVNRYLSDLKLNEPELFVEPFNRSSDGLKFYPSIQKYIDENYKLDAVIDGYGIYVRKGKIVIDRFLHNSRRKIKSTITEFHSDFQTLKRDGSFLYFRGWTVLTENVIDQKVFVNLINKKDTIVIPTNQIANSAVADFSKKKNYLMCGFMGFFPIAKIPKGDYSLWLQVENGNEVGRKQINRTLNPDSLLLK